MFFLQHTFIVCQHEQGAGLNQPPSCLGAHFLVLKTALYHPPFLVTNWDAVTCSESMQFNLCGEGQVLHSALGTKMNKARPPHPTLSQRKQMPLQPTTEQQPWSGSLGTYSGSETPNPVSSWETFP